MTVIKDLQNTQECFVQLWHLLERTRCYLGTHHKRFCIRNILRVWFDGELPAGCRCFDDFVWEVCRCCDQEGWNELPLPALDPRPHRELLRAIVSVALGLSARRVSLRALDTAFSIAFPHSTPLNVNKKKLNNA